MHHTRQEPLELTGTIIGGVGTGARYVAIPGFSRQFGRILGKEPFPGTLNIDIRPQDRPLLGRLSAMKASEGIIIRGFCSGGTEYFPAVALRCEVMPGTLCIPAVAVFPEVTVHPEHILEIVASERILDQTSMGGAIRLAFG